MLVYIRSTGNVSPQRTFGEAGFLSDVVEHTGDKLSCVEPEYRQFIDPKLIRRMGRIVKMGVAAALAALREAGIDEPEAIVTGTALGCMEDSSVFMTKLVENGEELLTPTAFIQSTHNTIGAQIALLLQCHRYNNTFAHRGFSFESALLDALLLLREGEARHVLVGGIDELTTISHRIQTRLGLYRREPVSNLDLFHPVTKGTIAGEGAAFFVLASEPSATDYARFEGVTTFYKPANTTEIEQRIARFLAAHSVELNDIDLIVTGRSGDFQGDAVFESLDSSLFRNKPSVPYKHLCGEYPTATAFALWLAASLLKFQTVPPVLGYVNLRGKRLNHILIYNHHQSIHHSLMLVSAVGAA